MADVLFIVLALWPFVVFCLLVFMVAHVLEAWTGRLKYPAVTWSQGAVIFACLAYLMYVWGSVHKFTFPDWEEICRLSAMRNGEVRAGFERIEHGMFPVKAACVRKDGTVFDLVPSYVNPFIYMFLAALVGCVATALYFRTKDCRNAAKKEIYHRE